MNQETIDDFEKLYVQIVGVKAELDLLSKKSPNDLVNKFKLSFVNQLLETANKLLSQDYMPFSTFTLFDIDAMPSNSDAVFILNQYVKCLNKLKLDNTKQNMGVWYWQVEDGNPIKTSRPD